MIDHLNATRYRAITRHITRLDRCLERLEAKRTRFSRYRPLIFFAGIALTYWTGWTSVILAAGMLTTEAIYSHRIGQIIHRHQLWREIKATQLARMRLDWDQIPLPPPFLSDEQHPFALDLDLTGPRSLHHLIDMSISCEGSQRLREWLLQIKPDGEEIGRRQNIIRELVPLARFRDKFLLTFRQVSREHLNGKKLLTWLQISPPSSLLQRVLWWSNGLAILNIVLFACYAAGWLPGYWILSFALYLVIYFWQFPRLKKNFDAIMLLYDELGKVRTVLHYLETYPYNQHHHLRRICEPFCHPDTLPSKHLKTISWLLSAVGLRENPMLALCLNVVLPWDLWAAYLIEGRQQRCAFLFPQWMRAWTELEALVSLANFAYLHPEYTFPDVIRDPHAPSVAQFQATEMGHPLIPAAQKICNDFSVQTLGELTVLTGSNMSGKSTFLKTIGVNARLAYAGGPVNATTCQLHLFRIATCLKVHDSITDGFSFFYAEVKRLRAILDALHAPDQLPVLFLIDEIFKGTNSRERLLGARAYLQYVARQPGLGVIATHDLELGYLADQLSGCRNAHFRDDVADGKMVFDYTLRQGICPTTNALKIMKMEGLPVESPTAAL